MPQAHILATTQDLTSLIDDLAPRLLQQHQVPGCQIAVRLGGPVIYSRALGVASAARPDSLHSRHIFKAASNGKPFAALLAMRLVDRGDLSLDRPIWDHLRSWRLPTEQANGFDAEQVTLRRLLCHQSGFTLTGFPQVDSDDPNPPSTADLLRGHFGPNYLPRLNNTPGGPAIYAGDGYTIMQLAIEDVTGLPLREAFDLHIARPLNLRSTWYGRPLDTPALRAGSEPSVPFPDLTDCHDATLPQTPQPRRYYPALASSGLFTTAEELTLLYTSLPQLLSASSLAAMLTPHAVANNGWTFGLGFALSECNGRRTFKHAGWSDGSWGAAEGLNYPGPDSAVAGNWPLASAAVLTNSARGKDVVLPILGAIVQRLTRP